MSESGKALAIIVPSRSRPHHVARMIQAWKNTGAFEVADLIWAIDRDDPEFAEYGRQFTDDLTHDQAVIPHWVPMVVKLNATAALLADDYEFVGFMGDDHVPRTNHWAGMFLDALRGMGTGIVYGNDLFQCEHLPTQWVMTSDIVRALGRMVPAPVDHLYCDNAVLALGKALGRIRYRGDVVIEHVHPMAGKGELDPQYERVNSDAQGRADRAAYTRWLGSRNGLEADVECVRAACGLS